MPGVAAAGYGDRIRRLRKTLGLSQSAFGEQVGPRTRQTHVSAWEREDTEPELGTFRLIADIARHTLAQTTIVYLWLIEGGEMPAGLTPMGYAAYGLPSDVGAHAIAERALRPLLGTAAVDETVTTDEEQARAAVRAVEHTVRAQIGDPDQVYLRQLRLTLVDMLMAQARDDGRPVPDFLYKLHYEIEKDTFG